MSTLRETIDSILVSVDKPFDHTMRQILRDRILELRALLIRRSGRKYGLDEEFKMSIDIPLVKVEATDSCFGNFHCTVMRTSSKVPLPIRLSRGVPYDYVGTMTGVPYSFMRYGEHMIYTAISIRGDMRSYIMNNGYIYLVNPLHEKVVRIRHAFENIEDAVNSCDINCVDEDTHIFLPGDLIGEIKTMLIGELLNNPKYKSLEINTNDNRLPNS